MKELTYLLPSKNYDNNNDNNNNIHACFLLKEKNRNL